MLEKLYIHRFGIFFLSQLLVLFGSLLMPSKLFESIFLSIFLFINILAGIMLIFQNKILLKIFVGLLFLMVLNFAFNLESNGSIFSYIKLSIYFLFYGIVTIQIIKQVWKARLVNTDVIFGLISGYISLGLIGFFICITIEIINPGSFELYENLALSGDILSRKLMYFSYITLLTIGYGEILPVSELAEKAAILIGLMGQIYLVIVTAIEVGKYINQTSLKNENR